MPTTMTREEKRTFLTRVHVGVISVPEGSRGPLTIPIWYAYEPGGEVWFVTSRTSRKGQLLKQGCRVSLCAQDEQPPYKYVSVEGPVTAIEPSDLERDVRFLAHRYLGPEIGDQYVAMTGGADTRQENVRVRMRPQRWLAVDFAKQFGA
jgi:nitroimidazol reductase NimA-like FMN-containing flavoprotein (pyridoxamine 5'-phosphate oxidase superfamily)